ncbi:MAG: hypothetical protein ACC653_12355 [Gammaproteobacteria bacterium]
MTTIAPHRFTLMNVLLAGLITTMPIINSASATELYNLKANPIASYSKINTARLNYRYREETGVSQRLYTQDELLGVKSFSESEIRAANSLEQYNATIYYALGDGSRHNHNSLLSERHGYSIDLGVNFKFIEQSYESEQRQSGFRGYSDAYPMFSASALFDLPLSGMTASVEGSYYSHNTSELSEYRAKVTYQIDNIFGVSGGWEQRQYQLDQAEKFNFDKQGLFVDLFYRF